MMRNAALRWIVVPVFALRVLVQGCGRDDADGVERVVLIVADTLRRDYLSPYGGGVATPNVERLARRGQVFTNAVASFHQTTMSVAAMFTGRTPSIETGEKLRTLPWTSASWCGMARFATAGDDGCIPARLDTLAEDLRAAGFETLAVVSNRLIFRPLGYEQGFDVWQEVGEKEQRRTRRQRAEESLLHRGDRVSAAAAEVLRGRRSDRFFLYVHYVDSHDYLIRPDLDGYEAGVRYLDRALGMLLDALEQEGLLDGAVVVFTADHGEYLGAPHPLPPTREHFGNPSYDSVLRVPLIVAPPTGLDSDRLIRSQDVRGLVRELAGLSGLPDADVAPDEVILSETFYQTYRRGRWKSMFDRGRGSTVLYDLDEDPGETVDLAAARPDVVAEHRARVAALTHELGTTNAADRTMSTDDEERLRALGYLE